MTQRLVDLDTPLDQRWLYAVLVELGNPWTTPEPIRRVLEVAEAMEWPALVRQSVALDEAWMPYDRDAACDAVWLGVEDRYSVLLGSADGSVRFTISRSAKARTAADHRNVVTFSLDQRALTALGTSGVELAFARLLAALPGFTIGRASATQGLRFPTLYESLPPPPFEIGAWLQVLAPRAYEPIGGAERLLRAPARVERRADGTIWIWAYPDPIHYDTEAAIRGMRDLGTYLRATK